MLDIEKIKDKYDKLKENSPDILSLEKVILLEKGKEEFELKYLSKITKLDGAFIYFKNGTSLPIDKFIKESEIFFGELTFLEKKETTDGWIIKAAFSFSLMSIYYYFDKKNVKYGINVYWDR